MNGIGPAKVAASIVRRIAIEDAPVAIGELIAAALSAEGWVTSRTDAIERAEKLEPQVLAQLRRLLAEANERGQHIEFEFNSSTESMVQGSCFVEPSDKEAVRFAKQGRSHVGAYQTLFSSLTPLEFEMLCNGVLRELGVMDPGLTPRTADEGIDFYGRLAPLSGVSAFPNFRDGMQVWLVGQAKHYPSGQAATPEIRELVGSVNLAKGKAFSRREDPYANLKIRVCDPVFFLFMTTGRISSAGWRVLSASGVIGIDGSRLATFLADQGVGQTDSKVDTAALRRWLDGAV